MRYFYEKRYFRADGEVYVKRYSRSFELRKDIPKYEYVVGTNVREASASRAKSMVRVLAFSNPQLIGLLTLTFKDNLSDEGEAHRRFDLYRRKVARFRKGWQFLGVKEYQKRGAIHFHLLVNFCPDFTVSPNNSRKFISSLWGYGFSDFRFITGDDKWRTELYLLKYLGKDKVKYFTTYYVRSRGLNLIEPRYSDAKEPLHPLAQNIFCTNVKNNFVENFQIVEYTYAITNKGVKNDANFNNY
jgi:hypothetical protein